MLTTWNHSGLRYQQFSNLELGSPVVVAVVAMSDLD